MNWKGKKLIVAAALIALLIGLSHPAQAQTAEPAGINLLSCITNPFSCSVYGISVVLNAVLGLFVSLSAWFVQIGFQFNEQIVNSPAVQAGFGVSLAVANLGFVLAIIVIALATILRSQTYGIKQLLWKLVVAAIIVNFSLVIAGAILGFSDSLASYFMRAAAPSPIGAPLDYAGFVTKLTSAFAPQVLFKPPVSQQEISDFCTTHGTTWAYICGGTSGAVGGFLHLINPFGGFSDFVTTIISQTLSAIFLLLISFTFLALAVMLLIRYVYIGILLILAPLAWLLWIFPTTKSNFSKWWGHFIKWSFFPAIMVFFLYLALLTGTGAHKTDYLEKYEAQAGSPALNARTSAAMAVLSGTQNPGLTETIGQDIILLALALGGLFAANSLSITGASIAIGLAKSAGGAIQGYAAKQGKRGASRMVPTKVKEKLETGGYRFMPKRMQAAIGAGFRKVERAGGSEQVETEAKWARDLVKSDPAAARRMLNAGLGIRGGVSNEKGMALIKTFAEEGKLKGLTVGGKNLKEFMKDKEGLFQSYGQGKTLDKATLSNKAMRDAEKVLEAAKASGSGINEAAKTFDKATKEFIEGLEKADMYKANVNEVFGEKNDRSEALAKAIAKYAPQLIPNALTQMSGPTLKITNQTYREQLNKAVEETGADPDLTPEDKTEMLERLAFAEDAFNRSYANNAFGFSGRGAAEQTGGAAQAQPAGGSTKNT